MTGLRRSCLLVTILLPLAGCGKDPMDPSDTTTTTTVPGAPSAQRYLGTMAVPPPQNSVPLDLSLFFGLPRANGVPSDGRPAALFDVTGGYNTGPGSFSGSITGTLDGTQENGTFTGVVTARLATGCEALRNYSGLFSRAALSWTPGLHIETCGGATPLTGTINPTATTQAATTSTTTTAAVTGTLTGVVTNASTGQALAGATVQIAGAGSATTNSTGSYTIGNVPSGSRTVTTSASGFISRTDTVTIASSGTTTFSTALVPLSAGGNITIVLTWGAQPQDLDSHLVGPAPDGERFHMFYGEPTPTPYVSLDVDEVFGFGPETTTIRLSDGAFVAGSYTFFVHNFSGIPGYDVSNGVVTLFQGGDQVAQFRANSATGVPTDPIWSVFRFTLTATSSGQIAITAVEEFTTNSPTGRLQRIRKK